jgi:hypothetical protein
MVEDALSMDVIPAKAGTQFTAQQGIVLGSVVAEPLCETRHKA